MCQYEVRAQHCSKMAGRVLVKHFLVALLFALVVLIVRNDARPDHKSGGRDRCRNDISRCMGRRGIPCIGTGYSIQCYSQSQRCNGVYDCPYGDDEQYCGYPIQPTATTYVTRTILRTRRSTVTRSSTSTTTSTSSTTSTHTSTTYTTSSTTTTQTTSWPVTPTSSTAITTSTLTTTLDSYVSAQLLVALAQVIGGSTCEQMVAPAGGRVAVAGDQAIVATSYVQTISIVLTPSCSATTATVS